MAKRGRPTVAASHAGKEMEDTIKHLYQEQTTRSHAAHFYCSAVYGILEAASDIPYLDEIFCKTVINGIDGIKEKSEIIEQLGRMREQDGYSDSDILKIARIAAKAYHEGCTAKEIKAYILRGRTRGIW